MTKRTFNFNVTLNTSVRGRGKWGDFLVALIPLSWCANILINSNFILRMIEWQNESSLFTIRVQGKQWYWVYKYDPNTAQAVFSTPKNIGHNRWRFYSGNESYNADTYYQAIHLAAHLEFQDSYSKFTKKVDTHRKQLNTMTLSNEKVLIPTAWSLSRPEFNWQPANLFAATDLDVSYQSYPELSPFTTNYFITNSVVLDDVGTKKNNILVTQATTNISLYEVYYENTENFLQTIFKQYTSDTKASYYNAYYDFIQLDETADVDSNNRHLNTNQPFRLIKV